MPDYLNFLTFPLYHCQHKSLILLIIWMLLSHVLQFLLRFFHFCYILLVLLLLLSKSIYPSNSFLFLLFKFCYFEVLVLLFVYFEEILTNAKKERDMIILRKRFSGVRKSHGLGPECKSRSLYTLC